MSRSSEKSRSSKKDARTQSQRFARAKNTCTICGGDLGEDQSSWALIWESQDCGACWSCVNKIRSKIQDSD